MDQQPTDDNASAWIHSGTDAGGKAVCLLTWGPVRAVLTPETVLVTARDLTAAAEAAEADIAIIGHFRETLGLDLNTAGRMVLDIRKRRPLRPGTPALRIAGVAGAKTGKPLVHIARGSMKGEMTPDEARDMALHWTQAAAAAQIDVRLRYALGEWDHLTPDGIERLFALVKETRSGRADRE